MNRLRKPTSAIDRRALADEFLEEERVAAGPMQELNRPVLVHRLAACQRADKLARVRLAQADRGSPAGTSCVRTKDWSSLVGTARARRPVDRRPVRAAPRGPRGWPDRPSAGRRARRAADVPAPAPQARPTAPEPPAACAPRGLDRPEGSDRPHRPHLRVRRARPSSRRGCRPEPRPASRAMRRRRSSPAGGRAGRQPAAQPRGTGRSRRRTGPWSTR